MEKDEKLKNENIESNDAQTNLASGLAPVYDALEYAGDIQPLDNIEEPQNISVDYDRNQSDARSIDRNKDINKKKIPKLGYNRAIKKVIVGLVVIVILVAVGAGGYYAFSGRDNNEYPIQTVYKSGVNTIIVLKNGETYNIGKVQKVSVSTDGLTMFYSVDTSSKTGKYDIRVINVQSKRSLSKSGSYIDNGVDEGWVSNLDGSYTCYSKTDGGISKYYMYSSEDNKAELITNNLEELYMPQKGDIVYFTRRNGDIYSLHRVRYGEKSENVASDIDYTRECDSPDGMEIIYTSKSGNENNVNVFIVSGSNKPVEACHDVSEVYPNEYVYGGNLYYFVNNDSVVDWHDFIKDQFYDSDAVMTKPVEGDYLIEKGFILKREVLDVQAYSAAVSAYNEKLKRDKVREALNGLNVGLATKEQYSSYVYNGKTKEKLATGVVLDNIITYSTKGDPKIIFRKSVIDVSSKIPIEKLVEITSSGSVARAMDYVRNTIGGAYKVSDECIYSWYDGNKVISYNVKEYNPSKTEFITDSRNLMFVLSSGKLYSNSITEAEVESRELIDSKVTSAVISGNYLYYYKTEENVAPTLYRCNKDGEKEKIVENVDSYFAVNDDYVIVITRTDSESEIMNIGIFDSKEYKLIDTNANLNYFYRNGTGFAYVKNNNELYTYTQDSGSVKQGTGTSKIYYTHE